MGIGHLAARLASLPLETRDSLQAADAIVVLGAPLRPDGGLSMAVRERVREGVRLYFEGYAPLLLFTGGAAHSAAEAPAMAQRAHELGVPRDAILVEADSTTTAENARYSARLLRAHNVGSVIVVSQPFHLRRGRRLLRRQGFAARAHASTESVQYENPRRALRWCSREYAAWVLHFLSRRY